jgi:hypothetical protein
MIDLGTIAGLHSRAHELHAYCPRCDRWRVLDLAELIDRGFGEHRLPLRVRCGHCGGPGQLQVRPPAPTRAASGWIPPPTLHGPLAATNRRVAAPPG